MTEAEYRQALKEKADYLYHFLRNDPLPVPAFCPKNEVYYPQHIQPGVQERFWVELVEKLQVK